MELSRASRRPQASAHQRDTAPPAAHPDPAASSSAINLRSSRDRPLPAGGHNQCGVFFFFRRFGLKAIPRRFLSPRKAADMPPQEPPVSGDGAAAGTP